MITSPYLLGCKNMRCFYLCNYQKRSKYKLLNACGHNDMIEKLVGARETTCARRVKSNVDYYHNPGCIIWYTTIFMIMTSFIVYNNGIYGFTGVGKNITSPLRSMAQIHRFTVNVVDRVHFVSTFGRPNH